MSFPYPIAIRHKHSLETQDGLELIMSFILFSGPILGLPMISMLSLLYYQDVAFFRDLLPASWTGTVAESLGFGIAFEIVGIYNFWILAFFLMYIHTASLCLEIFRFLTRLETKELCIN